MKNKIICIALFILSVTSQFFAQQIPEQENVQRLKSGITVAVFSKTIPPVNNLKDTTLLPMLQTDFDNETKLFRSILDSKNSLSYDYSLEVTPGKEPDTFKVKFKLEDKTLMSKLNEKIQQFEKDFKDEKNTELKNMMEAPLAMAKDALPMFANYKNKPLPKYPDEVTVNDGDAIVLDILEDPQTGAKVQDLIRITKEDKKKGFFVDLQDPKDFALNDVQMMLQDLEVYENGKLVYPVLMGRTFPQSISGSNLILYNQTGKLLLSAIPKEGYNLEKLGSIEDNKIVFSYNGNKYKIVSKTPILGKTGKWSLWIGFKQKSEKDKFIDKFNFAAFLMANDDVENIWK